MWKKVEKIQVSWNILPYSYSTIRSTGMVLIYPRTRPCDNSMGMFSTINTSRAIWILKLCSFFAQPLKSLIFRNKAFWKNRFLICRINHFQIFET